MFRAIYGSFAHGTSTPTSDEDWRGVFLLPNEAFLGLDRAITTYEAPPDQVFWELGHFCRLLLKGNPNIVGMLWAPDDCVDTLVAEIFAPLVAKRGLFLHRGTVASYLGWAHAELRSIGKLYKGNAKRLSHVPRLLWELQSMVQTGDLVVRPDADKVATILGIKTGATPYTEAVAIVGNLLLDVEAEIDRHGAFPHPPTDWTRTYLLESRAIFGA